MQTRNFRSTRIAAVAAALAASMSCFAGGGEALDIELPSMRSPAISAPVQTSQAELALVSTNAYASASFGGALTREQVRAQLKEARASGTLSMQGEAGDTPQVLAARDVFNTAQGEAIMAAFIADQQRTVALAEAEMRRAEIETEGQLARSLALGEGEVLVIEGMPEGAAAVDSIDVRIDVIDTETSASARPNELVIVALDGGDEASQRDQAIHVRRQLGAMGLSQGQIYVESTGSEGDLETVANAVGDAEAEAVDAGEGK